MCLEVLGGAWRCLETPRDSDSRTNRFVDY